MQKIPISGGPHSGKTTLLEALKVEFPDAYFVPEPAETVITRELAKQAIDASYEPIVPWIDYTTFGPAVADESEILEGQIPSSADLVFQDRSLIDTIGYCKLNKLDRFIPEVQRRVNLARYAFALFCEPVGDYTATEIRRETAAEAQLTHDYLGRAYDQSGIPIVHLPAVSVAERLMIIRTALANSGSTPTP
jgi:predicted ATPase